MSDRLVINPETVQATADAIREAAEEADQAGRAMVESTSNEMSEVDPREFAFRQGLADATVFWSERVSGLVERLVDGAEYMETNTALACQTDAEGSSSLIELGNAIGIDDYTRSDYYEATGAEPPAPTGTDAAMPVGGESAAVP